jgi:hypothetical protein
VYFAKAATAVIGRIFAATMLEVARPDKRDEAARREILRDLQTDTLLALVTRAKFCPA